MSTAILPDGSLLVCLDWQTIHVDLRTRAIHLRTPSPKDPLGGDILESFPLVAVDRVRLLRAPDERHHLTIELVSGRSLSLGHAASHEEAMNTARVLADLTRCKVEVSEGVVLSLPGASPDKLPTIGDGEDPFDEPTHKMVWGDANEETTLVPEPQKPPRVKTSSVETLTEIVIKDADDASEDPLDYTVCRPASTDEVRLRIAENGEEDAA
jgi:hypothetical protein